MKLDALVPRESWTVRTRVIQRIALQEVRDAFLGWGVYLTAAAGALLAVLLVYNSVRFVAGSGLGILARPFLSPLQAALSLILLHVTVGATLAISRPREQGALQILFFAPVDPAALIGAHLLSGVLVYAAQASMLVLSLALLAALTNVFLPPGVVAGTVLSLPAAVLAIAFGLFLSAVAPSSRSAVLLLVAATALVFAIQGGYSALLSVPPTSRYYDALLFLRAFLRTVNNLLAWGSPFGLLSRLLDATLRADLVAVGVHGARAVAGAVLWLALAIWAVHRRGVLP